MKVYLVLTTPYPCTCNDELCGEPENPYVGLVAANSRGQARYLLWRNQVSYYPLREMEWKETRVVGTLDCAPGVLPDNHPLWKELP